jgi:hypothetical protein
VFVALRPSPLERSSERPSFVGPESGRWTACSRGLGHDRYRFGRIVGIENYSYSFVSIGWITGRRGRDDRFVPRRLEDLL